MSDSDTAASVDRVGTRKDHRVGTNGGERRLWAIAAEPVAVVLDVVVIAVKAMVLARKGADVDALATVVARESLYW